MRWNWRIGTLASLLLALPAAADEAAPEVRDAAMAVLDRYLDALNDLDFDGHLATLHFPHFRYASGEIAIWQTREDAMAFRDAPAAERKQRMREALHPDWHRSVWLSREIVQSGPGKVHVTTRFARQREDGSEIVAFDSLYVLAIQDGRWGIKGRSSFAP